jgi:hypothetical protein
MLIIRRFNFTALLLIAIASVLTACAATSTLLVERFSRERSCQADRVRVHERGGNEYVAEGCGQRAEYLCQSYAGTASSANECSERGLPRQASPEPTQRVPHNAQEPPH